MKAYGKERTKGGLDIKFQWASEVLELGLRLIGGSPIKAMARELLVYGKIGANNQCKV